MSSKKKAAYDISLLALMAAIIGIAVAGKSFASPFYTAILFLLVVGVCVINTMREAYKEAQLDEMQLAAASFGARWAVTIPLTLLLLTLFVSPLQNAVLQFTQIIHAPSASPVPPLLRVFTLGAVFAVMLQMAGKSLIGAIWAWTKR